MNLARKYALIFFLSVPFAGGLIPEFQFGPILMEGERLFLLLMALFVPYLFVINNFVLKVSSLTVWLLIYYAYLFINRLIQDTLVMPEVINFSLPIFLMLYFDNIDFKPEDYKKFTIVLAIVGVGSFLASFIQLTIDPFFYSGGTQEAIDHITHYEVMPGVYRNNSLYRGLGANEGAIALGCLSTYFLFQNFYRYQTKYLILTGMLAFGVFVIFAKYCWLMFLIAGMFFLYHRYPKSRTSLMIIGGIVLFFIYFFLFEQIEQSAIYKNRISAETYTGRTESSRIFFETFFARKPIFGFGVSSWDFPEYLSMFYIGIHVGFFDILFRGGIIAIILLIIFWIQVWRKSYRVYEKTGNPMFFAFIMNYFLINSTAVFISISFYGYYMMLFALAMYYKLFVIQGYAFPASIDQIKTK